MKRKYTRKQILESIKYWKKQLNKGNYKKLSESNASIDDRESLDNEFKQIYTPYLNVLNSNCDALCDNTSGMFEDVLYDLEETIDKIHNAIISDYFDKKNILNLIEYLKNEIHIPIQMWVNDINSNECIKACKRFDKDLDVFLQDVLNTSTSF